MSYGNSELIQHIRQEITFILTYTEGKAKEDIIKDEVLSRAIIRSIAIIGEASKKLDAAFKAGHPEIEWKKMSGTRDRLIHDYLGVDFDIIWNIIEEKLPFLQDEINRIFPHP